MEKFGSGINIPDRQYWCKDGYLSLVAGVVDPEWFIPDPNPTFQVFSDTILIQGHVLKDKFDE
jgi:hypothetical protein